MLKWPQVARLSKGPAWSGFYGLGPRPKPNVTISIDISLTGHISVQVMLCLQRSVGTSRVADNWLAK